MALVDLHVHSKHSGLPSDPLLRKLGSQESYTEVDDIYHLAKKRGMDFVTITDHNSLEGSLELVEKYPQDTFTGAEITAKFPEDGCKVHVLCFDINPAQFYIINNLRNDIYALRNYIKLNNIAYSVAHATFAVNGKLSIETLEKLILLFDVFEGINGSRNIVYNQIWIKVLNNLTSDDIDRLYRKYKIEPMSRDPWIKGLTGGSDDHAGLFIGKTFARSEAVTKEEFLSDLRSKLTVSSGRSNCFRAMVYILGKIGYDFANHQAGGYQGVWGLVSRMIFEKQTRFSVKESLMLMKMRTSRKSKQRLMAKFINRLGVITKNDKDIAPDDYIDNVYDCLADFADDILISIIKMFHEVFKQGKLENLFKAASLLLFQTFVIAPFLGTWKLLNTKRHLVKQLQRNFDHEPDLKEKKVLWFSDTIADLNGVSSTLRKIARFSEGEGYQLKLAVCSPRLKQFKDLPSNIINLDSIFDFTSALYPSYTMHFPSMLRALDSLFEEHPDEIIISTPGPMGLLGMLVARLSGIKAKAIYHTDFTEQMRHIEAGETVVKGFDKYLKWFYANADEVRVPSAEYIAILAGRGYHLPYVKVFRRGIDHDMFYYDNSKAQCFRKQHGINGPILLYAGRVSEDKNISFLGGVYRNVLKFHQSATLVVAGDGPGLVSWKKSLADLPQVIFLGGMSREEMKYIYSLADLLVFPSITDTFGMVVLEAQACSLPCLVSDRGGPQSIVMNGQTGQVLPANNYKVWTETIVKFLNALNRNPGKIQEMRELSRAGVLERFCWPVALEDLLKSEPELSTASFDWLQDKDRQYSF